MKEKLILFCASLLMLISCKESETVTTIISGSVIDYYSGDKIPNAEIRIVDMNIDPSNPQLQQLNPYQSDNKLANIVCDGEGNYNFSIDGLLDGGCKLILINDSMISVESYDIETGKNNQIDVIIKKLNRFSFLIDNVTNSYDSLIIGYNNQDMIDGEYTFIGYSIDTLITVKLIPETELWIGLEFYKHGIKDSIFSTNISTVHSDTMKYEIRY